MRTIMMPLHAARLAQAIAFRRFCMSFTIAGQINMAADVAYLGHAMGSAKWNARAIAPQRATNSVSSIIGHMLSRMDLRTQFDILIKL